MNRHILYILSILAIGFVVGCDKSAPSARPEKGPVVTVGSHVLTDEMVKARVALMQELKLRKKPTMTAQELGRLREQATKTYPEYFVMAIVQEDYAAKERLEIPEARIATNRQVVFRAYRKRGEKVYEDMLKNLGPAGDELERQIRSEVIAGVVRNRLAELYPTNIPPSYADEQVAAMERQNREMAITNAMIFAQATNVWKQLKAGGDFKELAQTHTQVEMEKDDGGYWGEFDRQMLSHEPSVIRFGRTAKPGEFTPPIEADNGLMILRLNDRRRDDAGVEQYDFSRIFFMLPEFYVPAPKDAILRAAHERYVKDLYNSKLTEMIKAAAPVYRKDFKENKVRENKEAK